jgi:hypothetical protein
MMPLSLRGEREKGRGCFIIRRVRFYFSPLKGAIREGDG